MEHNLELFRNSQTDAHLSRVKNLVTMDHIYNLMPIIGLLVLTIFISLQYSWSHTRSSC